MCATSAISKALALAVLLAASSSAAPGPRFEVVIRGGTVYDGTGAPPRRADLALVGDRIVKVGELSQETGNLEIDARGLAVAPGFVNMLSWSNESLVADGRSQGEIRQGVTTEVMGEGWSMGPVNETVRAQLLQDQVDIHFDITWKTLGEYLGLLERRGIAPNVGSFVGATTVREYVLGLADKSPDSGEMERMRGLVGQAMREGAFGVSSSLIYAPASYSTTEELTELCKAAAPFGGMYISHIRSEGDRLLEGVDELIRISREARIPAEIYHLKAAGESNWPKLPLALSRIEAARRDGLRISADMYTYTAAATGFDACVPRWALDGGIPALVKRISDPDTRGRISREMATPGMGFENLCLAAGSPERILLTGFKSDALKPYAGKTLDEVAGLRGRSPLETVLDLIAEDHARIEVVFFLMSEENVRKEILLPWVSFGSDASSMSTEGVFLRSSTHPRAYGNFARLLGHYVRDEGLLPLEEAVRRLSGFPAQNLGLKDRGVLKEGMFADVVVFDPATIADRATYENPHQYAVGMKHVFVNGVQVLKDGSPTGALPGRALKGRGAEGGR